MKMLFENVPAHMKFHWKSYEFIKKSFSKGIRVKDYAEFFFGPKDIVEVEIQKKITHI